MTETIDLRPDFIQLRNLFRQVQPSFLVASGPINFLTELIQLLDMPEDTNINKFKVHKSKPANANATNVSFYPFNRKSQHDAFRKKIYELNLPGLPTESSKSDRQIFIDSVFPMKQELTVIALGNLLNYLDENHLKWRHAFLNVDRNPIVTNLTVSQVEAHVLIDDSTFNSLNIFSTIYHPSSFKAQVRKDGLSLFNLLNQCCSSVGVQELKMMLKQPIRDILELNLRYSTIDWCLKPENFESVRKLRTYLTNLLNISSVVSRIIVNFGKTNDWKSLKKTVYYSFMICELCASFGEDTIKCTFLHDLASFSKNELTIKGILYALDKMVDLDGIEQKKRFMVKEGLDKMLDEKRESLKDLINNQNGMELDESLRKLNDTENVFRFVHFPEMGFVVGSELRADDLNLNTMQEDGIELVLQTVDATYLRTPNCSKMNDEYVERFADIISHELRIFNRLMKFINENLAELIDISKLCAKLDCLIAMASIAKTNKFIKPTITTEKQLEIINGRHPLVELIRPYKPSTTIINEDNRCYINIINAPNASGKSVYMKQIALICYMAHIGCFVPAEECRINLLHSIYTRIYTPESVYEGESAFMTDLQQMSKVIMNSTDRSLVLIDEFGKGTHFRDGIALLTASIEHFIERGNLAPLTFITTHYSQVYNMLQSKELTMLKTIETRRNEAGVFESLYEITDGANAQNRFTEFPESKKIMANIFGQTEKYENSFFLQKIH
jgi:DNA mismatch repair protein MSH5